MVTINSGGLIALTTSKRKGFFTASFLILLLIFAISTGALSLVTTSDLSDNCLGYHDENYILAQIDLEKFQEVINQDPRFPDFQTFAAYLKEKNYLRIPVEQTSLFYLKTMDLPNLGIIVRFKLTQTIAGKDHIRFVLAKESLDGGVGLFLSGVTGQF